MSDKAKDLQERYDTPFFQEGKTMFSGHWKMNDFT